MDSQTGLLNGTQVSREVTRLLEENRNFTAVHLDIHKFQMLNEVYGSAHGNKAIRLLADIAGDTVRQMGSPDDLVGHLGGDDFMVITTTRKAKIICRRIIAEFERQKKALYPQEDLQERRTGLEDRPNRHEPKPVISLHAAVIINEKNTYRHFFEIVKASYEQLDRLKNFPGSLSYFDIANGGAKPDAGVLPEAVSQEYREDSKTMFGVLAWLAALTGDIKNSLAAADMSVRKIEMEHHKSGPVRGERLLASAKESLNRLTKIVEVLEGLVTPEYLPVSSVPDEVNLDELVKWTVKQVQPLAEPGGVPIDIQTADSAEQVIVDGKSLACGLQYLLRAAVAMSAPGERLQIGISRKDDEYINLRIANPQHCISHRTLINLQRILPEGLRNSAIASRLFPARLLIQGLGGKLDITSDKDQGTVFTAVIPGKWQSWANEINTLAFATSVSRKQARDELEKMQQALRALSIKAPAAFEKSMDNLGSRVQELAILCNRSLYLVEDFSSRLERQQERFLQQETERFTLMEAILTTSREMAKQMNAVGYFFDVESAQRVAKIALTIANEFNMSPDELNVLHLAALLKDLGLAISAPQLVKHAVVPTIEEAIALRTCFSQVWKALSVIPFLSQALYVVIHRNERFDGSNGRFGIKGINIPLGARILAVADAFEQAMSGLAPGVMSVPDQAVKKIVSGSGTSFDPDVVNAFLRTWKRKELNVAIIDRTASQN
ncbi:MAG: HD domain-containing phosphohydrolase [Dehalococcoidales bacterium]